MTIKADIVDTFREVAIDLDAFGEAVTYTPKATGIDKSITAVIERDYGGEDETEGGTGKNRTATVHISSDATAGVASSALGDSMTFDSIIFKVVGPSPAEDDGSGLFMLMVRQFAMVKRSPEGFRLHPK